MRRELTGRPDTPLHASDIKLRSPANFDVLKQFFLDPSFARMAVTSTARAEIPHSMHPAVPVIGKLQEHIAEAMACIPCDEVVLIVEASQRADPVLVQHFGELRRAGSTKTAPIKHCFMPKRSGEPGLEVADFIISAAKSETLRYMKGAKEFAPDFSDVFRGLPLADRWFSIVTGAYSGPDGVALDVLRAPRQV